jgi:DNA-binding XRE family transcriptional regulator
MPRGQKFTAEQIISKLREAEVELARGKKVPEAAKQIGVTEQTYLSLEEGVRRPPDSASRSFHCILHGRQVSSEKVMP